MKIIMRRVPMIFYPKIMGTTTPQGGVFLIKMKVLLWKLRIHSKNHNKCQHLAPCGATGADVYKFPCATLSYNVARQKRMGI